MGWIAWALLSAVFAAATALLAKVGIKGIDSNLATAIRTSVVLVFTWAIALSLGHHHAIADIGRRSWVFLVLSGMCDGAFVALLLSRAADGAGVEGGADRQAERGDCDCVCVAVSGREPDADESRWVGC